MSGNINDYNPNPLTEISLEGVFIWLDILGFSHKLEQEEYKEALKILEGFRNSFSDAGQSNCNATMISDGIVLRIETNRVEVIKKIFRNIGEKQLKFILETGHFVRGGIALGTRYVHNKEEKSFHYISNGLARAYKIESRSVHWPIVATNESQLKEMREKYRVPDSECFGLKKAYNKEGEEIFFIDFLEELKESDCKDIAGNRVKYEKLLIKPFREEKNKCNVRNKFLWLIRHYLGKYGKALDQATNEMLKEGIL